MQRAASAPEEVWTPSAESQPDIRNHNIFVAAFGKPYPSTLHALGQAMPEQGTVTVISEQRFKMPKGKYKVNWVHGHPASAKVLESAGAATADALLVTGVGAWDDTEADIQVPVHQAWHSSSWLRQRT